MSSPLGESRARFLTTRWSLVRGAGRGSSPESREALEELCRIYWYPLYAYVRRDGAAVEDARDLVQGFFSRFLAKNYFAGLDEEGGLFRSYLLGALKHYLANERERARALKRGGGREPLPLELEDAEERYACEPADPQTPEKLFLRKWALALLARVLERLRAEQEERGRGAFFACLKGFLAVEDSAAKLGEAARSLGMSDNAARVAIHRLRSRYRELLLQEVAQTVDRPQDVEGEIAALFAALEA